MPFLDVLDGKRLAPSDNLYAAAAAEQGTDLTHPPAQTSPTVLTTKLFVPTPRPGAIGRTRLIERLNEGLHHKLTLISAPAGFGKTTLLSEWVAACEQRDPQIRTAWLSLDDADNDLTRFLTYLLAALQTLAPSIGAALLPLLQDVQKPPIDTFLTALLNDITQLSERFLLILDDYHLINAKPIDEAIAFLIEHLPPQLRLVITTREDPDLPLARLRARGQLTELRAKDLRFTPVEAAEFLNQGMGLNLSAENIALLEARTEGWIAGLQLAALSLQGQTDIAGFIGAFAGDHRYIVDYLVEEVLDRQPDSIRSFLLQTSILDRFNASLCEAVTHQKGSHQQLEMLERGNFFIVPLDDKRQWYRYHHLFAEVLSAHLAAEQPDQVALLHQRASTWYEQNHALSDAIRHALIAKDYPQAAILIERSVPSMRQNRQEATLLGWLQTLPDEVIRTRPALSVHYAGVLLQNGQLDGVDARLSTAEHWLSIMANPDEAPASALAVIDDPEDFRRLPSTIAMYRAASSLFRGQITETVKYARQTLEFAGAEEHLLRGGAAGLLALAHWTSGDLDAARQWYSDSIARLERVGHFSDAIGCTLALADILITQGRLREAMRTYEYGLQLASQGVDGRIQRGAADMHVGISQLHYEHNALDLAMQSLLQNQALGEFAGLPQNRYRWRVALARVRTGEGNLDNALELLGEAAPLFERDFSPDVQPIPALQARLWIAQGRVAEAFRWAQEHGLSVDDDLSYLREFVHITLARVLLARYKSHPSEQVIQEAMMLLDRLGKAAEAGNRTGSEIEILILQALAHAFQGNVVAALVPLERALTLAEPEGYVRLFVDEGSSMQFLLNEAAKRKLAPKYVAHLLSAFGTIGVNPPIQTGLIEPLSARELEVLRLLATDLSGPEIARHLMVSLNTLRTHTKNIFTKLGVNNRLAAIHRADDLDLL